MQNPLKSRKPKTPKSLPRLFAILTVLLVVLAGLLYARPVDVYTLAPGLTPETAELAIWPVTRYSYGADGTLLDEARTGKISRESPEFQTLLTLLGELNFQRSPLNLIRPYLHGVKGTYPIEDGDESWVLHLNEPEGVGLRLQFCRSTGKDIWTYDDGLPCTLAPDQETAEALHQFLWETAEPVQSDS